MISQLGSFKQPKMARDLENHSGFALLGVLLLTTVLLSLLATHMKLTRSETTSMRYAQNAVRGFYTAEAGLNIRAAQIRETFAGYNRPTGTNPAPGSECIGGNDGNGDYECMLFPFGNRQAVTFLEEDSGNPYMISIPPGERFQNLSAQEYRYTVTSQSLNSKSEVEAVLKLKFKSRLVPLFQFAAFYNKDLEILPGPKMDLEGPVHVNGDLYLSSGNGLDIAGQVTSSGALYKGRKNNSTAGGGPVRILDPLNFRPIKPGAASRSELLASELQPWNGMIQRDVDVVEVPAPDFTDPTSGNAYWDKADLRLVLKLDSTNVPDTSFSSTGVEVRSSNGVVETASTSAIDSCVGSVSGKAVGSSSSFYDNREVTFVQMIEIDIVALFDCIHSVQLGGTQILTSGRQIDDTSEGGLVFHFTVEGPDSSNNSNNYGVRVRNGAQLQSTLAGAPLVQGLTIASDQAFFVVGDYNSIDKIPASFIVDTFNVLSSSWDLSDATSSQSINNRKAGDTTIQAAILAGTDVTGGQDGAGGQGGSYNGGLENYPRFHEKWSGSTLTYYGSFVSLDAPRHSTGSWNYGAPVYTAPKRDWHYDKDFNDAANLPPLSPRFVYLKQELFSRDFDQ